MAAIFDALLYYCKDVHLIIVRVNLNVEHLSAWLLIYLMSK